MTNKTVQLFPLIINFFGCNWQALNGKFCTWNHNAFLNETWMKLLKLTEFKAKTSLQIENNTLVNGKITR